MYADANSTSGQLAQAVYAGARYLGGLEPDQRVRNAKVLKSELD